MQDNPLVSVIIPVYCGDPYMREAIDSALAQTYKNIEIIVVNDGSDDGGRTDEIARSYGDKIRYFSKENSGVSGALNYGIRQMRGEWFAWLSHDDLFLPEKTERQLEAVKKSGCGVCVVRCTTEAINENGDPVFRPQRKLDGIFSAEKMLRLHSLKEVGLYGCTLLIHREIIEKCGGFDEGLRAVQDEDYWNSIFWNGYPFLSISDALVKNRVHARQATNKYKDLFEREHYIMCERVRDRYLSAPEATVKLTEIFTYKQLKERRKQGARLLKKALRDASGFSLRREAGFVFYSLSGVIYTTAKRLYRKIVVKRHR